MRPRPAAGRGAPTRHVPSPNPTADRPLTAEGRSAAGSPAAGTQAATIAARASMLYRTTSSLAESPPASKPQSSATALVPEGAAAVAPFAAERTPPPRLRPESAAAGAGLAARPQSAHVDRRSALRRGAALSPASASPEPAVVSREGLQYKYRSLVQKLREEQSPAPDDTPHAATTAADGAPMTPRQEAERITRPSKFIALKGDLKRPAADWLRDQAVFWHDSYEQLQRVARSVHSTEDALEGIYLDGPSNGKHARSRPDRPEGLLGDLESDYERHMRWRELAASPHDDRPQDAPADGTPLAAAPSEPSKAVRAPPRRADAAFEVSTQPPKLLLNTLGVAQRLAGETNVPWMRRQRFALERQDDLNGAAAQFGLIVESEQSGRRQRWSPLFETLTKVESLLRQIEALEGMAGSDFGGPEGGAATAAGGFGSAAATFAAEEQEEMLSDGLTPELDDFPPFLLKWAEAIRHRTHLIQQLVKTKQSSKMYQMSHKSTQCYVAAAAAVGGGSAPPSATPPAAALAVKTAASTTPSSQTPQDDSLASPTAKRKGTRVSLGERKWFDAVLSGPLSPMNRDESLPFARQSIAAAPVAAAAGPTSAGLAWLDHMQPGFQRSVARVGAAMRLQSVVRGWLSRRITGDVSRMLRTPFMAADGAIRAVWLDYYNARRELPPFDAARVLELCARLLIAFVATVAGGAGTGDERFSDVLVQHFEKAFASAGAGADGRRHLAGFLHALNQFYPRDCLSRLCFMLTLGDLSRHHERFVADCAVAVATLGGTRSAAPHQLEFDDADQIMTPAMTKAILRKLVDIGAVASHVDARVAAKRLWRVAGEMVPSWAPPDDYETLVSFDRTTFAWFRERSAKGHRDPRSRNKSLAASVADMDPEEDDAAAPVANGALQPAVKRPARKKQRDADDELDIVERRLSHKQILLFLTIAGYDATMRSLA